MNHDFCTDGSHGSAVEGEHAFHGFVGREKRIGCARAHHVESDVCLLEVFAPVGQAVSSRCAGSDCDEVVFPGADGPFGRVGAVNVGWCVLEFGVILGNEVLDVFGGLIV